MTERDHRRPTKLDVSTIDPHKIVSDELDKLMDMVAGDHRPESLVARQAFSILKNYGQTLRTPSGERYTVSLGKTIANIGGKDQELRLIHLESDKQDVTHVEDGAYLTIGKSESRRFIQFEEDRDLGLNYLQVLGADLEWRDANPSLVRKVDRILDEIEEDSKKEYPAWKKEQDKIQAQKAFEKSENIAIGIGIAVPVLLIGSIVFVVCNSETTSQQDIADEFDPKNLVIDTDTTLKIGTTGNPVFAYELLDEQYVNGKVPELERCDYYYYGDCTYDSSEYDLGGVNEPVDIDQLRKIDLRPNEPELYKVRFDTDSDTLKALTTWPAMEEISIEVGRGYIRATWIPSDATMQAPGYSEYSSSVNLFVQRQPAPEN